MSGGDDAGLIWGGRNAKDVSSIHYQFLYRAPGYFRGTTESLDGDSLADPHDDCRVRERECGPQRGLDGHPVGLEEREAVGAHLGVLLDGDYGSPLEMP
ncbi:hypothetical protein [Kocuria sabuli]|uniref:hypothetical protein n=1 Tax=Kocuria sabuli TaxID=3071448 RepID=UPI0034D43426